jgi:transcriptional regulator with XRE-family HTH domain
MAFSKTDIKISLLRAGVTQADIARRLNLSVSHVSCVIGGRRRSARIERAVAQAIGHPVDEVFAPLPLPARAAV